MTRGTQPGGDRGGESDRDGRRPGGHGHLADGRLAAAVGLLAVVAATVVLRAYDASRVVREWGVVLPGNDPYSYLHAVERVLATTDGVAAAVVLAGGTARDPLFLAAIAGLAARFEPTPAGVVLAWYPVVAAALVVPLLYRLVVRATGDRVTGLTAGALLAVVPAHAVRTRVGFADHHAFDGLLAVAAAVALAAALSIGWAWTDRPAVARPDGRPSATRLRRLTCAVRRLAVGTGLAVVVALLVAAQVLAWIAGVVYVFPAAAAVAAVAVLAAVRGRSPLLATLPAIGGLCLAAVLVAVALVLPGWGPPAAPAAVAAVAGVGLAAATGAELALRVGGGPRLRAVAGGATTVVASVLAVREVPEMTGLLVEAERYLDATSGGVVAETVPLFGGPWGVVTGPLSQLGLVALLALPGTLLAVRLVRRGGDGSPALLVLLAYAGWLLALAALQRRFAAELAPFASGLAAVALVALARAALADLDADRGTGAAEPERSSGTGSGPARTPTGRLSGWPVPDGGRRGASRLSRLVAAASGLAARVAPAAGAVALVLAVVSTATVGAAGVAVKANQATVGDDWVETGRWVGGYADAAGLDYPARYVLTPWPENRLVNYLATGIDQPTLKYGYARTNYDRLLALPAPDAASEAYAGRVGFVVTTDDDVPPYGGDASTYARLHRTPGPDAGRVPDLGHYRLVHVAAAGARTYELVPGATLAVPPAEGWTATATATVLVDGEAVVYRRTATRTPDGWTVATVAYPGRYAVGGAVVTVTAADVRAGRFVGPTRPGTANWTFPGPEADGEVALDRAGGHHGRVVRAAWVPTAVAADGTPVDGGLAFDGDGAMVAADPLAGATAGTVTVRFRTDGVDDPHPRLVGATTGNTRFETAGYLIALDEGWLVAAVGDGLQVTVLRGPRVDDGRVHEAALAWDDRSVRLFLDGRLVATGDPVPVPDRGQLDPGSGPGKGVGATTATVDRATGDAIAVPLVVGAAAPGERGFQGVVDEVTVSPEARPRQPAADGSDPRIRSTARPPAATFYRRPAYGGA
jgi:dolichyl-diphosphooligosaccharide--protein glycosyltransferase